jgi:hypothetical protein
VKFEVLTEVAVNIPVLRATILSRRVQVSTFQQLQSPTLKTEAASLWNFGKNQVPQRYIAQDIKNFTDSERL